MGYNTERNKCMCDPIYFIEHYIMFKGKHIVLKQYQKLFIKKLYEQYRITQRHSC